MESIGIGSHMLRFSFVLLDSVVKIKNHKLNCTVELKNCLNSSKSNMIFYDLGLNWFGYVVFYWVGSILITPNYKCLFYNIFLS